MHRTKDDELRTRIEHIQKDAGSRFGFDQPGAWTLTASRDLALDLLVERIVTKGARDHRVGDQRLGANRIPLDDGRDHGHDALRRQLAGGIVDCAGTSCVRHSDASTGSMKTSIVPPQESPTSQAISSEMP